MWAAKADVMFNVIILARAGASLEHRNNEGTGLPLVTKEALEDQRNVFCSLAESLTQDPKGWIEGLRANSKSVDDFEKRLGGALHRCSEATVTAMYAACPKGVPPPSITLLLRVLRYRNASLGLVRTLLECGRENATQIDKPDSTVANSIQPLSRALLNVMVDGRLDLVELLIAYGTELHVKNKSKTRDQSMMVLACDSSDVKIATLLWQAGARDADGRCLNMYIHEFLHGTLCPLPSEPRFLSMVELFLKHGVDSHKVMLKAACDGLFTAKKPAASALVRLLVEFKANVDRELKSLRVSAMLQDALEASGCEKDNVSPFELAMSCGNDAMVRALALHSPIVLLRALMFLVE